MAAGVAAAFTRTDASDPAWRGQRWAPMVGDAMGRRRRPCGDPMGGDAMGGCSQSRGQKRGSNGSLHELRQCLWARHGCRCHGFAATTWAAERLWAIPWATVPRWLSATTCPSHGAREDPAPLPHTRSARMRVRGSALACFHLEGRPRCSRRLGARGARRGPLGCIGRPRGPRLRREKKARGSTGWPGGSCASSGPPGACEGL